MCFRRFEFLGHSFLASDFLLTKCVLAYATFASLGNITVQNRDETF